MTFRSGKDEESRQGARPDFRGASCPLPLRQYPQLILGHGGGGTLSGELVEHLFLPAFRNAELEQLADSAVLEIGNQRIALATDSFVVRPLFFPGGSIGELAVNGTVNDLAMSGACPKYLTAGFIAEEGFPMASLAEIAGLMGDAARRAGVQIVAGDTKVVEKGHGDGCYINTTGIGIVPRNVRISPKLARPGDAVLLSGTIGDHGMAIMSVREGLEFETEIRSDTAPLANLVQAILAAAPDIHCLRDPTRGGVASSLNELAAASGVGIEIEEARVPVQPAVQSACEILGLDPLHVANEGKLLAILPPQYAEAALDAMRNHEFGRQAAIIGHVTEQHPAMVVARTSLGATRVVTMQIGEQLPRIC